MSFQTVTDPAQVSRIPIGGQFDHRQMAAIGFAFIRHIDADLLPRLRELVQPILTSPQGTAIHEAEAALQHVRNRIAANQAEVDRSAAAVREHKSAFEAAVNADDKEQTEACKRQWFAERDAHEAATLEKGILASMELRAEDAVRAAAWSQFGKDYQAVHNDVWSLYRVAHEKLREKLSDPTLLALVVEHKALTEAVESLGHTVDNITNWRGVLFENGIPGMEYRPKVKDPTALIVGPVIDYGHLTAGDRPSGEPIVRMPVPVGAIDGELWTDSN